MLKRIIISMKTWMVLACLVVGGNCLAGKDIGQPCGSDPECNTYACKDVGEGLRCMNCPNGPRNRCEGYKDIGAACGGDEQCKALACKDVGEGPRCMNCPDGKDKRCKGYKHVGDQCGQDEQCDTYACKGGVCVDCGAHPELCR